MVVGKVTQKKKINEVREMKRSGDEEMQMINGGESIKFGVSSNQTRFLFLLRFESNYS